MAPVLASHVKICFAPHPQRGRNRDFFFFLAAFLILFGVGGLLAAPNPQPPSRERSQREARAWGDFKGHAVQLKSPVKPNRVALTNYFAPGWTRALPLKGTGEARRVYIYRYYWCLPTFFFFFLCYNFVYINRISFQNLSSLLLEPALCWGVGKALSSPAGIGRPRSGGWRFTAAAGFQVRALCPGGN